MGQFLRINGDYNIKAGDGARITLDTGAGAGEVRITGDLIVEGDTTTVEAENLNVEDNVITLNFGETGAGVTKEYSGILVDRGTEPSAALIWNENIGIPQWRIDTLDSSAKTGGWQLVSGGETSTDFDNSRIKLREILTDSTTDNGNLLLIGKEYGIVHVLGTTDYEDQVTAFGDDAIPNKKYVDDSILNNPTFQILRDDTRVIVADKNVLSGPGSLAYLLSETTQTTVANESAVSVIVDNELVAQIYNDRLLIGDERRGVTGIEIDGINFEIRPESSVTNQDIFVKTDGIGLDTGKLRTNVALKLDKRPSEVIYQSGFTLIYAGEPNLGTSGVFFSNDSPNPNYRYGELISKNKALVFSMIF